MHFITLLQPPQDCDRRLHRRLLHKHRLKTPLQRRVLLDVLAIFVERGRANASQFAARKLRLEHVRRVRCALRRPGPHEGVQFINEQNDFPFACRDFLEKRLEPVFKFAAILGPGDHRAQVHRDELLVFQRFRHVTADDPPGQPLGNRCLAHARFANQHRVVLRAPRQHLHHPPDFLVAPDHGINLPRPRQRRKVAPIFLQRLKFVLGIRVGDALVPAKFRQRLKHVIGLESVGLENLLQRRAGFGH